MLVADCCLVTVLKAIVLKLRPGCSVQFRLARQCFADIQRPKQDAFQTPPRPRSSHLHVLQFIWKTVKKKKKHNNNNNNNNNRRIRRQQNQQDLLHSLTVNIAISRRNVGVYYKSGSHLAATESREKTDLRKLLVNFLLLISNQTTARAL